MDRQTTKIDIFPNIMPHKIFFRKHVTLPPHTVVWVKAVSKMSGQHRSEPNNFLWRGWRVREAKGIHEGARNKPFEILLTNFFADEKKLIKKMALCYATKSRVIHLAVTRSMAAYVCDLLHLTVLQTTASCILQPRTKLTVLIFNTFDEENINSASIKFVVKKLRITFQKIVRFLFEFYFYFSVANSQKIEPSQICIVLYLQNKL